MHSRINAVVCGQMLARMPPALLAAAQCSTAQRCCTWGWAVVDWVVREAGGTAAAVGREVRETAAGAAGEGEEDSAMVGARMGCDSTWEVDHKFNEHH